MRITSFILLSALLFADVDAGWEGKGREKGREKGEKRDIEILLPEENRVPWGGHAATWAIPQLYELLRQNRTTLVFTNTRFLAEYIFQHLWDVNEENLPIGVHHGSLSKEARRKVEGAMARGELRALVATASLDLETLVGDKKIGDFSPEDAKRLRIVTFGEDTATLRDFEVAQDDNGRNIIRPK